MPEILEVELSRRLLEAHALGRRITAVDAPDAWYLKRGLDAGTVRDALVGSRFVAARRRGKLLLLDTDRGGPVLGLHFGMTGRVFVDDRAAHDRLYYLDREPDPAWDRFVVQFGARGELRLSDPRRLGAVELDPDEDRLGIDAFALTRAQVAAIVRASRAPLKAVLLDQARVAGLGNLLVDEILWRAGIDPARPARSLDDTETAALARAVRETLRVLGRRGGSHTGDLMEQRVPGGVCPRDGAPLTRRTVGGRTTYSCPVHQR
ncbi:MAG: DNA-formamidopyrimidine glycosylase family protein [Acidimicrobiia bacterium]